MAALNAHRATGETKMKASIRNAAAIAAMACACVAHAGERAVARLVGVTGNVLVSNDNTIASAGEALRLVPGMRVLATLNSSAVVEFEDGCRVKVQAGERFEVRGDRGCAPRAQATGLAFAPVLKGRP
jgi:hypothetical protein